MVRSVPIAFDMPILLKFWTDQVQILSADFMCVLLKHFDNTKMKGTSR